MVGARPPMSRRASTANITAGSVGASAAPMMAAVVHETGRIACAASVPNAAVRNVPATPLIPSDEPD